jgi:hypothetical protein
MCEPRNRGEVLPMTDDQAKRVAAIDQSAAVLRDTLAPMLASFHRALMVEGMREDISSYLTSEYMRQILHYGVGTPRKDEK